jgi:hypothetical protein
MPGSSGKSTADFQDNLETDRIWRVNVDRQVTRRRPAICIGPQAKILSALRAS